MLNFEHLLDLAVTEAQSRGAGTPRQAKLRRSVSTSYYAIFHALMQYTAGRFVPPSHTKSYSVFYRALDHGRTRERCKRLAQNPLPREEIAFFDFQSFPDPLRSFAADFVRLQELRHKCDYDPDFKITKQEALSAIERARVEIDNLKAEVDDFRKTVFFSYLLFGLRG